MENVHLQLIHNNIDFQKVRCYCQEKLQYKRGYNSSQIKILVRRRQILNLFYFKCFYVIQSVDSFVWKKKA